MKFPNHYEHKHTSACYGILRGQAESTLYEIYTQDYDVESEDHNARFYLKKGVGIVRFEYEGVRYTQIK